MPEDREHLVRMNASETNQFRKWLERPSGSFCVRRVTIESVENGGIWVRTQPRRVTND